MAATPPTTPPTMAAVLSVLAAVEDGVSVEGAAVSIPAPAVSDEVVVVPPVDDGRIDEVKLMDETGLLDAKLVDEVGLDAVDDGLGGFLS